MIKLEALNLIISGNDRDDLLYEWYLNERAVNPDTIRPADFNKIERAPASGPKVDKYEGEILKAVMRIAKSRVGAVILGAAMRLPEPLYILPIGARDAVMMGGYMSSCLADEAHVSKTDPDDKLPPVKINPRDPSSCKPLKAGGTEIDPQNELDSSLVHEMAHAVRPKTSELWKKVPTGDPWLDFEEFFATIVQNMFKSERGDLVLRGGHDESILSKELATSAGFMKDLRLHERIEKLYRAEPLAQKLGRLKGIKFNPFGLATGQKYGLELI
ncbi:hypothetical protein [Methylocella silvestris]|uniref:Uncharacterized protein n=1 Tax=Methylocella silvestris TaxID=199596 RepID=A0A2J7TFZ8_METSI|nr:hypothetical protein [Methylocella silvestris]PNG25704.1 hypothetical protein CR492_12355 [Methylocella silvestris]